MFLSSELRPAAPIRSPDTKTNGIGFASLSRRGSTLRCHLPITSRLITPGAVSQTRTGPQAPSGSLRRVKKSINRTTFCRAAPSNGAQSGDPTAATIAAYAKLQNGSDIRGFALDSKYMQTGINGGAFYFYLLFWSILSKNNKSLS